MVSNDGQYESSHVEAENDNPYLISIQVDPEYEELVDAERLYHLARFVLQAEQQNEALQLGVTITSDAEIHKLNAQYLGHDYATDVLSFGAEGEPNAGGRQALEPLEDFDPLEDAELEDGEDLPDDAEDDAAAAQFSFVTPPGLPRYLGDIVISYDTAALQAPDYGQTPAQEVDVLLAHGVLHLLDYDDHDPAERERMHKRQEELVRAFAAGA